MTRRRLCSRVSYLENEISNVRAMYYSTGFVCTVVQFSMCISNSLVIGENNHKIICLPSLLKGHIITVNFLEGLYNFYT